jgi:dynein heavy chain
MTGFFNAQGFLTAMRQEVTRANKDKGWALDTVVLTNEVTSKMKDEVTTPPASGVYVYGLFLEGAAWSKTHGRLTESKNKILFDPMPVMHISATNSSDAASSAKTMNYVCPIYKKPKRTDRTFIATVNLKTNVNPETWVLRGTCLLCDTK